jgi:hypothetical protein
VLATNPLYSVRSSIFLYTHPRKAIDKVVRKQLLRAIAVTNVALALLGAYDTKTALSAFPVLQRSANFGPNPNQFPDLTKVFYTMTSLNVLFLVGLLASSYWVWRIRPFGRTLINVVILAEVGYWFSRYIVKFALLQWADERGSLLRNSIAAANALGNAGISAQFDIWYPLIVLVTINILYSRLNRSSAQAVGENRSVTS